MIRRIVSIVALTVIVTALAALGLNGNVFAGFQRRATDALLPSAPSDPHVVVVGFDRKTIATPGLGNPLPRDKVAELVDQLKADGARVIGFDVTYSQENQEQVAPDALLAKSITNAGNVVLAVKGTSGKQDHGVVRLDNVSGLAAGLQRRGLHRRPRADEPGSDGRGEPQPAARRRIGRRHVRPFALAGRGDALPRHQGAPDRST